jgi:hypothetical protein
MQIAEALLESDKSNGSQQQHMNCRTRHILYSGLQKNIYFGQILGTSLLPQNRNTVQNRFKTSLFFYLPESLISCINKNLATDIHVQVFKPNGIYLRLISFWGISLSQGDSE